MNCTVYMVGYNFAIHVTCPLTFTTYKYNVLQVLSTTQKLSYKASCKTPFFFHSERHHETFYNDYQLLGFG